MGWLFSFNLRSKKELVTHLRRTERFGEKYELLRATTVGNNHWYLCRKKETGSIHIGFDKMAPGGKREGWGHKDMSEGSGPSEVDCPLSYLDAASEPTGYAVEWRERVRSHHAKKAAMAPLAAGLIVTYGDCSYRLVRPAGPHRGWNVERTADGMGFRMNARQLTSARPSIERKPVTVMDSAASPGAEMQSVLFF